MDNSTREKLAKASVLLPAWICLKTFNPLGLITKHVIMLYFYKTTFQESSLPAWLQQVVVSLIARDYFAVVGYGRIWPMFFWMCTVIAQYKIQVHHALFAYLGIMLFLDFRKSIDLMLFMLTSSKCPKSYENIVMYLFLQRLFSMA